MSNLSLNELWILLCFYPQPKPLCSAEAEQLYSQGLPSFSHTDSPERGHINIGKDWQAATRTEASPLAFPRNIKIQALSPLLPPLMAAHARHAYRLWALVAAAASNECIRGYPHMLVWFWLLLARAMRCAFAAAILVSRRFSLRARPTGSCWLATKSRYTLLKLVPITVMGSAMIISPNIMTRLPSRRPDKERGTASPYPARTVVLALLI